MTEDDGDHVEVGEFGAADALLCTKFCICCTGAERDYFEEVCTPGAGCNRSARWVQAASACVCTREPVLPVQRHQLGGLQRQGQAV